MYLIVLILDQPEDIQKVISEFRKIGITGATVFDSVGLGRTSLYGSAMPKAIASLKNIFNHDERVYNHTLISIIREKETLDAAFRIAEETCGDFNNPDVGIMFSLELERVLGFCLPDKASEA